MTRTDTRLDSQVYQWWIPQQAGLAAWALIIATVMLLGAGPPTWRASRWAWFWLMATPVGLLAYLVLAGPTPGVPPARTPFQRLRGGRAFFMALLSTWFLPTWWH